MSNTQKRLGAVMTHERVYEIAEELYLHENGTVTADYPLNKCHTKGHKGCVAVFKLLPCGCVQRGTWHTITDETGEVVGAKWEDGSKRISREYQCSEHRRRTMRKHYNYRSDQKNTSKTP